MRSQLQCNYELLTIQEKPMSIRKATTLDAKDIKELVSSLSHYYLENKGDSLPAWFSNTLDISEFERRLSNTEYANYVYLYSGKIVGYISIKDNSHLYHLFVSEKHHGQGISKLLWEHAIAHSSSKVYTLQSSIYAIPIYKKFGFVEVGGTVVKEGISFQPMELVR